eukprot:scaffold426040_cov33-Prasinocladus_malaysianus.AAC.2
MGLRRSKLLVHMDCLSRKAKAKRERMRRAHGAADYISMHDTAGNPDLERALERRHSDSGSGSEDEDRDARL